jgi:hypothetical protein
LFCSLSLSLSLWLIFNFWLCWCFDFLFSCSHFFLRTSLFWRELKIFSKSCNLTNKFWPECWKRC